MLGALGLATLAAGLALLALMPLHASSAEIVWRMALCGFGFGFFQAPNNRVLLATAPRARAGAAGGMLAVARLLGFTVGTTIAASVFRLAPARRRDHRPGARRALQRRGGAGQPVAGWRRRAVSPVHEAA